MFKFRSCRSGLEGFISEAMELGRACLRHHATVLLTMMMFKWGILCTATADICLSSPCQNGGTCVDAGTDYVCICPKDPLMYVGKSCEVLYDACAHVDCPGCVSVQGTERYSCPCAAGFGGPDCTVDVDECQSNPCTGIKSYCADGVNEYFCYCPMGYGGEDCQASVPDCSGEPCLNNGTCVWGRNGYECRCARGFEGEHCEQDVDECLSQPCQNGAICLDGIDAYHCFCVPGFQGYHCEIDINECASQPCENNGTCVNGKDRYICECLLGYTGKNCELEIDECEVAPCQNGAICNDYVGLYTCDCLPGFEGINCELDIDECASEPCINNGRCTDKVNGFECDCSGTGFVGEVCEEDIPECVSNPCQHGATCQEGVNQYTCLCWPGYEGTHCEVDVDECEAQPCQNGGECFQRSDQSHYGVLPQLDVEFSYERASGFVCSCPAGFTGQDCSVNIDECESAPCLNGGSCEDFINRYQCSCPPGFTGVICEVNIDECEHDPCRNGASCEDGVNEYICHCLVPLPDGPAWGGTNCDVPLTGCVGQPCHNGATCVPLLYQNQHRHKCKCPPGFYGEECTVPTTFSFSTGGGYVLVEVPHNRTRRETGHRVPRVTLRFRTTLPDVVLFFRGSGEHFFALEMSAGNLFASAESGDLRLKVQAPGVFNDGLWHTATVSVDEKLVLILLDKGDVRIEDGGQNQLPVFHPHGLEKVFVGGAPPELLNKTRSRTGFVGCMEDLDVDARPFLPQNASPEKMGCEKTEWCHPDSCSQKGRCVDLWTKYRCECNRPYYGSDCNYEHSSWTFNHERNRSFAAFPITQSHGRNVSVSFFLRSRKHDGLVFQLRRDDLPYFTVFLRRGAVHVSVYSAVKGSSTFVVNGEKVLVSVDVQGEFLYFNRTELLFGPGNFTGFEVEAGDEAFLAGLPGLNDTVPWGGHFKGCLQDVRLDGTQLYLSPNKLVQKPEYPVFSPSFLHNILESCLSDQTCRTSPCVNGGKCQVTWNDFECACPMNYTGKTCNTRVWCVSDPCVMGTQCVDLTDGYECLANATFENNALKYSANGSLSASVISVSVDLRTSEETGTLLRASNGLEFFCLGLANSSVQVKIRKGNSLDVVVFTSEAEVSDGTWHRVELKKSGTRHSASRWHLLVDGLPAGSSRAAAGNLDFFNHSAVWLAENFTGCLGEVRVGGVYLPLMDDLGEMGPQASRFTLLNGGSAGAARAAAQPELGCIGAPLCQSNPCLNGGLCQDLFNRYRCQCTPGWEGERCQHEMDECASSPCVHGACRDLPGAYECRCERGYRGQQCDQDVDECQELQQPCKNGGTCFNTVGGHDCICLPDFSGPFCQWNFPPLRCDSDVQCANGGVCMDGVWGANCTCKPGYIGDRCEVDIDECESNPCLNGATCMDRQNHYLCDCLPGFSGDNCEAPRQQQRERLPWLVLAIPLLCLGVLLGMVGLVCMALTARKKRQSEGTYSPSQQEVAGARLEMGSVLKVPPEERLI